MAERRRRSSLPEARSDRPSRRQRAIAIGLVLILLFSVAAALVDLFAR